MKKHKLFVAVGAFYIFFLFTIICALLYYTITCVHQVSKQVNESHDQLSTQFGALQDQFSALDLDK